MNYADWGKPFAEEYGPPIPFEMKMLRGMQAMLAAARDPVRPPVRIIGYGLYQRMLREHEDECERKVRETEAK